MMEYTLKDLRSGNLLAGDFAQEDARKLAHDLNVMVLRNTGGVTPARVQEIEGGTAPVVVLTPWATWHRDGGVVFSGPFVPQAREVPAPRAKPRYRHW